MKTQKRICQSCAAPLSQTFEMGTEKDGRSSPYYCRRCYIMGEFTEPKMDVETMHENVRQRMIKLKFPRFLAKLSADSIFTMKRWAIGTPVEAKPEILVIK